MNKWEIIDHTFKFRVGDSEEAGGCTLIGGEWKDVTTNDLFKDDEVYCISVNDAFVMNAWARDLEIKNVVMIPDGCGTFTRSMGMLVNKPKQGFGMRSWRYSAVINNGVVEKFFEEPGFNNESNDDDPYTVSSPEHVLQFLKSEEVARSV